MEDQKATSGGTESSEARSECKESRKEQQPENHKLECQLESPLFKTSSKPIQLSIFFSWMVRSEPLS